MPEATIIRTQIIVVNEVGQNSYGDLTFTDKEGKDYKISNKRKQYFEKIIVPDMAVQLNYASAYGKEYIYSAVQVKDKLPTTTPTPTPKPTPIPPPTSTPPIKPLKVEPKTEISGQEHGLSKNRAFSLSYAKDLSVADRIPADKILSYAEVFLRWLDGDIKVVDEEVFKALLKKTFNVV